ncbi:MAG: ABC transporter ATP-binding protein [Chloroflexota bacterium]
MINKPLPIWKYLAHLIRYAWGSYLLNLLLWLLLVVGPSLATGLIIRAIFDTLTNSAPLTIGLVGLMTLLVVTAVVEMGILIVSEASNILLRLNVSSLLRRNLFAHLLQQPGAKPLPESPSEAISRFRDDIKTVENLVSSTANPIGQLVFIVVAVVVMIRINLLLTLVVFLPLLAMLLIASAARHRLQRYHEARQVATGQVTGFIGEMFGAIQAIKVNTAETAVLHQFGKLNAERGKTAVKDHTFTALLNALTGNTVSLGTGIILLLAAQSMANGRFSVGDFALFVIYLRVMTHNTDWVGYSIAFYRQSDIAFARLQTLMGNAPPEKLVEPAPIYLRQPVPLPKFPQKQAADRLEHFSARQLSYRFGHSENGIFDIDLEVPRGSFTVITGRVGSGKTTLLRLLLGLLPLDAGELHWNGRLLTNPDRFLVPPRCAYTPQVPRLFSDTLRDNILLGVSEGDVDWDRVLETAVFTPDIATLEKGLDTTIGPRGVKLSGGQIQRAAAARMLVRQPELFVVDDLSSALDVETERLLWSRLTAKSNSTFIVVSHRRAVLQQADQVLVLQNGRLLDSGPLNDLLTRCSEMQQLWHEGQ